MTTVSPTAGEQLTALRAAVDGLLSADLSSLAREELLGVVRGFETESRRLVAVQHRLVAEVQDRNVAGELHYRDTAGLLSEMLLLTPGPRPTPGWPPRTASPRGVPWAARVWRRGCPPQLPL
jgi:hypothetical protein